MPRLVVLSISTLISACGFAGKSGEPHGYQPLEGDIVFKSLPNPPGMDLVDAIEGPGNLPLDRPMITPRDLAMAKELTRVFPAD